LQGEFYELAIQYPASFAWCFPWPLSPTRLRRLWLFNHPIMLHSGVRHPGIRARLCALKQKRPQLRAFCFNWANDFI
jgi:hypothetical protein